MYGTKNPCIEKQLFQLAYTHKLLYVAVAANVCLPYRPTRHMYVQSGCGFVIGITTTAGYWCSERSMTMRNGCEIIHREREKRCGQTPVLVVSLCPILYMSCGYLHQQFPLVLFRFGRPSTAASNHPPVQTFKPIQELRDTCMSTKGEPRTCSLYRKPCTPLYLVPTQRSALLSRVFRESG